MLQTFDQKYPLLAQLVEHPVEARTSLVRSQQSGQYLPLMKIVLSDLKRLVGEAVADHMRLPKGPNSRDDAEDRPLEHEGMTEGALNESSEQSIITRIADDLKQSYDALEFSLETDVGNVPDSALLAMDNLITGIQRLQRIASKPVASSVPAAPVSRVRVAS